MIEKSREGRQKTKWKDEIRSFNEIIFLFDPTLRISDWSILGGQVWQVAGKRRRRRRRKYHCVQRRFLLPVSLKEAVLSWPLTNPPTFLFPCSPAPATSSPPMPRPPLSLPHTLPTAFMLLSYSALPHPLTPLTSLIICLFITPTSLWSSLFYQSSSSSFSSSSSSCFTVLCSPFSTIVFHSLL